jgi:hypothetical protein
MDAARLKYLAKRRADIRYAHGAVHNAIKYGRLKPEPCRCGTQKTEAHHEDYTKPLDVRWLCKKHHVEADKEKRLRDALNPPPVGNHWTSTA